MLFSLGDTTALMEKKEKLRVAAVSDVHYDKQSNGDLEELFIEASAAADVFLLCGDLTSYGLPAEADVLAEDIRTYLQIPALAVFGNHDFEADKSAVIREIMEKAGVTFLDGQCTEVEGVGFAGVRGFAGGFDEYALNAWGESVIKEFVQEAVNEALKLERALSRLEAEQCVVLLHYAPIRETVEGESPEVFPFLGSSRLEDVLNHYHVTAAFHGHAHHGRPEGQTTQDIPIYNVSLPVLRCTYPDGPPLRIVEIACS